MLTSASAAAPADPAIERTLQDMVRLAAGTVEGAAAAGFTVVRRDGTLETLASTDERAARADRAQAVHQEGPWLMISTSSEPGTAPEARPEIKPIVITIDDMAAERRWPRFAAEAKRLRVRSMISCGLPLAHGGKSAALNVYATSPSAFDETAAKRAALYAKHACAAFEQATLISSLRSALESRQAIGEATGILMERDRVAAPVAFQKLVESSQRLNVKVRRIAQYVVHTGQSPQAIELDDLGSSALTSRPATG